MNKNIVAATVAALLVGAGAGYWSSAARSPQPAAEKNTAAAVRKPLFYRNPMNPSITSPVPAKDDMGMDYVPVYADDKGSTAEPAGTVKIDPTVVQDIGVRTAKAERTMLSRHVRTVGRVALNEERVARLHPKYDGWVQHLFVDKTGEKVKKNTMLLSIYSPQVVATEDEYLLALDNRQKLQQSPFADVRDGAESLLHSSRERLQLLDMPTYQLRQIERTHKAIQAVQIDSPFDGVVMNIGAREGSRITPDTELYMIADLSRIWVLADLYQDDLPWVHVGDIAKLQVNGIPGRTFTGKVSFIYPYFEAKTRTVKVRLVFDNPDLLLKPEMYANVDIQADKQVNAIAVPSEAIVRSGAGAQVFVVRAPGKFEPRDVTLGVSSDGKTQILSGLNAGETVVTSSEFLIDSESKLREATAKMLEPAQPASAAPASTPDTNGMPKMQSMSGVKNTGSMQGKFAMQGMSGMSKNADMQQNTISGMSSMPGMPAMQKNSAMPPGHDMSQQPGMGSMQHDGKMNMGGKP